jgi:hypothetical protein
MPGYHDVVSEAWNRQVHSSLNPLFVLHTKLSRTAKALKFWAKSLLPQPRIAMAVCREVILQLETAQESRQLIPVECDFIAKLKLRIMGLAAIEKCRARQKSRIIWLRKGDANTKNFHVLDNVRKQKNFIHSLHRDDSVATTQQEKHQAIFDHFLHHIGAYVPRSCSLNLNELQWQPKQLQHLDLPFSEQEIKAAIFNSPKEKAPGPDGFIGLFFTTCWEIIKQDIMGAMNQFYILNQQGLHFLNQALVVLIPKKENASRVTDFRPISLTHNFAKILTKVLASRLGPELDHLISINQSAFIRKRCSHDNFMYVQEVIKDLHKRKVPSLFIKLDISKAFDTVNWPYLLQIMIHLGFGHRWTNWISTL